MEKKKIFQSLKGFTKVLFMKNKVGYFFSNYNEVETKYGRDDM